MTVNKQARRLKVLIATLISLFLIYMPVYSAQSSASGTGSVRNLGTVEVTGTRIRRANIETAQPVQRLSREQLEATGLTNVGDILQNITSAGSAVNTSINNGNIAGATHVNLRNLGAKRVLVLVNGRRWITGLGGSVDLNTIPISVIQRIEVLKDGASAIYGSDAIAGVVNIITKRNYNGAQASAYVGVHNGDGHTDGRTQHYDATIGASTDKGNVVLDASYTQNNPIMAGDRKISQDVVFGTGNTRGSSATPQGRFRFTNPITGQKKDLTLIKGQPGTSVSDFRSFKPADHFNFAPFNYLLQPLETSSIYAQGQYELLSNLTFHTELLYNKRNSAAQLAPSPAFFQTSKINVPISKDNPYNPFGFDLNPSTNLVSVGRRMLENGPRHYTSTVKTDRFGAGLTGNFEISDRAFNWDVNYIYSSNDRHRRTRGFFNTIRLGYALGPASQCGPGTVHPDCVPFNLFGGQFNGGSITQPMLNYATYIDQQETYQNLRDYTANISSSDLVDLPGGPLGIAIGAERRELSGFFQPSTLRAEGNSSSNTTSPTSGGYRVNAYYAELKVPVISNLAFAQNLNFDVATRYSDYSNFGSNTSSRIGLKWQPINDLLLRATYSQGFRAPNINELFGGHGQSSPNLNDPCSTFSSDTQATINRCVAAGVPADGSYTQLNPQIRTITGGNNSLQPETSISKSVGFVYSPSQVPNFNVNVDYFRIDIEGSVQPFGGQQILDGCYRGAVKKLCSLITRARSGAGQGNILRLLNVFQNFGSTLTDGFDVGANYTYTSSEFGSFRFQLQSSFLRQYVDTLPSLGGTGSGTVIHRASHEYGNLFEGFPKNKTNLSITWNYGNFAANYKVRFISALTEKCADSFGNQGPLSLAGLGLCSYPNNHNGAGQLAPRNRLDATAYHDVQLSYTYSPIHTDFTVGVRNLTGENPPVSFTAFANSYEPTLYDLPGRYFYFRLQTKF